MARTGGRPAAPVGPPRPLLSDGRSALTSCSRPTMLDLGATYEQLARPWSHEQLAAHYHEPNRRGERIPGRDRNDEMRRPIALLASSIPQCTSLSVAVHVLHVLPSPPRGELAQRLLDTIDDNATAALHLCHRALELDGRAHDHTADEWLPAVYDITAPLLEGARLHREPPSVVEHAQEAVHWLSQAIINLDQDASDATAAIADVLGRLLALCVFADLALSRAGTRST
jgi:hypothetical protein